MNMRKFFSMLMLGAFCVASYATMFDCKVDFSKGEYNKMTEEEMIQFNNQRLGVTNYGEAWEKKKQELVQVFIDAFNYAGRVNNMEIGSFENSPFKLFVDVIQLDPDGEVEAHVLAYRKMEGEAIPLVFFDNNESANGGGDASYIRLSTKGFRKLGTKLTYKLYNGVIEAHEEQREIMKERKLLEK